MSNIASNFEIHTYVYVSTKKACWYVIVPKVYYGVIIELGPSRIMTTETLEVDSILCHLVQHFVADVRPDCPSARAKPRLPPTRTTKAISVVVNGV